jgi:hypothetical protein
VISHTVAVLGLVLAPIVYGAWRVVTTPTHTE